MTHLWPWLVLLGLGALHGINPAMGWLFALCLGLQERRRSAVLAALPPIALGHAFSVGAVVLLVALLSGQLQLQLLKTSPPRCSFFMVAFASSARVTLAGLECGLALLI